MESVDSRPITDLLLAWQAQGRAEHFTALVTALRPLIERRATTLLRRCGILSPAAIDDAVSLVLDHLRRLHAASDVERLVAPFTPRSPTAAPPDTHEDEGRRYVVWLTKSRTRDIVRAERRRAQKTPTFTDAFSFQRSTTGRPSASRPLMIRDAAADDPDHATHNRSAMVMGCVRSLPEDQRQIVELLLAGLPQAVIARALGISPGTLSRRKVRAFATLRNHLCDARQRGFIRPAAAPSRMMALHPPPAETACCGPDAPPFTVFSNTATEPTEVSRGSDWHLFVLVTRGVVRFTWLSAPGRPEAYARDGTCGYFPPSGANRFRWEPEQPATVLQVAVAPRYFQLVADTEDRRISSELRGDHCFEDSSLSAILRRFENRATDPADILAAESESHAMIMRLLELQGHGRPRWHLESNRFNRSEMRTLCDYVRDHLGKTLQFHALADLVGLSPGHFARKFRLNFGISPAEFVRARRVQEAARLLRQDHLSIAEIAERVGFSSQSRLARVFRSIVGTSPAGFRAECS